MKIGLRKFITGLTIPQEYICIGKELSNPLRVFLTDHRAERSIEVTNCHLFLGYKPLIIAFVFSADHGFDFEENKICLHLNEQLLSINTRWRGFSADSKSIARLQMKRLVVEKCADLSVGFYEGVFGKHRFIPTVNQKVDSLLNKLRQRSSGNISLSRNLYDQVRIAYAISRTISLITVSDGQLINIFPTDLHGPAGNDFYISSLRIGGEACRQVEQNKKIVISEIEALEFQTAYQLGKNHMRKMCEKENFNLAEELSQIFRYPLPKGVGIYRELELINSFDIGIHHILIYKVVSCNKIKEITPLAHIHQYYAQWRDNTGLETHLLLR